MCTIIVDGHPRIIAWTASNHEKDTVAPKKSGMRRKRKTLKVVVPKESLLKATATEKIESSPLFSGYRIPVRITTDQKDLRLHRNLTKRTIKSGEKVTTPIEFVDLGRGVLEEIGGESWYAGKVCKYYSHDSHGKHGRKPVYKDHPFRRDGSGKARAVAAFW